MIPVFGKNLTARTATPPRPHVTFGARILACALPFLDGFVEQWNATPFHRNVHRFEKSRRDFCAKGDRPLLRPRPVSSCAYWVWHVGWNRRARPSFYSDGLSRAGHSRLPAGQATHLCHLRALDNAAVNPLLHLFRH